MYNYINPFGEISAKEGLYIGLDYTKDGLKSCIEMMMYNNSEKVLEDVMVYSQTDKLLLNPILIPPFYTTVKNLFYVNYSSYKGVKLLRINSLDGKYMLNKSTYIQNLKFVINNKTYTTGPINLEEIVTNVSDLT